MYFLFSESETGDGVQYDHFDFNIAVSMIPNLEEIHICYGYVSCVHTIMCKVSSWHINASEKNILYLSQPKNVSKYR